jgi:hypothetical protein
MRQVTYAAMSITAATMGVAPCAAHKIAYEGYWFAGFLVRLPRLPALPGRITRLVTDADHTAACRLSSSTGILSNNAK